MGIALRLGATALVFALGLFAQKPNKPDFSGTWQLDLLRTRFGNLPQPKKLVLQIEHREPLLRILTITTTAQGETRETLELTTDGVQHTQAVHGQPCTATARWDQWTGSRLVVEVNGTGTFLSRRFNVGTKGKILTTVLTVKDRSGEKKANEFFFKQ